MCNAKVVNWDILPSTHVPRNLWWYPFGSQTYAAMVTGTRFVAPKSYLEYAKSALTLLPFALKKYVCTLVPNSSVCLYLYL
jgi:hypothetical protein